MADSFSYEQLIASGEGKLFGADSGRLPLPPMLMFDRITHISEDGGAHGLGKIVAELDVNPDLWFFKCHFQGDPVMPGCLGLDAMWQLIGFYLTWLRLPGRGRALGAGEVKFTGEVGPDVKRVTYEIDIKRVIKRKLIMAIGDARLLADGKEIYVANDLRVGLFLREGALRELQHEQKRVVITGAGIVSCIGNDLETVEASLRASRSGIKAVAKFTELGLRSQVGGVPEIDIEARIDRKQLRFMGDAAAYSQIALEDAIQQAGLTPEMVSNPRTGLIMGSGGGSPDNQIEAADTLREKGIRRVGPYQVTRCMSSTVSACLATNFKVKGINYSITSACSTSAHCIGAAAQQIAWGMQDVMFAGGGEELSWGMSLLFDGMGAMSSKYNETPEKASRAYDANRDGFVIAGGGGAVVLESLDHALARGAHILAEVVGFGATSDGEDMVAPSGDGAIACMKQAMETIDAPIDYINTHGTSTPVGDMQEVRAMKALFGDKVPPFSSTKSLTGHSLGATGVQEAIYCLIMLNKGFIAGSANVETPDPLLGDMPLVTTTRDADLKTVLSNSFGFGGTNASLVLKRWEGK